MLQLSSRLQRLPTELSGEALQEWMLKADPEIFLQYCGRGRDACSCCDLLCFEVPFEPLADLSVWSWKREDT